MKIFLDANIILNLIDLDRNSYQKTKERLAVYIKNGSELYTSCDIFTTIYYVASKKIEHQTLLNELEKLLTFIEILPIDINTITKAMQISKQSRHKDLEDILQYTCAKENNCNLIVTNDKKFYSPDIKKEEIS